MRLAQSSEGLRDRVGPRQSPDFSEITFQDFKHGRIKERMKKLTKDGLVAWIEQQQPVTRGKLLGAFEDVDYEQLQGWLSELQRERRVFEVNPETYYTTVEVRETDGADQVHETAQPGIKSL